MRDLSEKPLRVLVVDDNQDAADTLAMLLDTLGHEVRAAYTGEQALQLCSIGCPDVIFADIGMPKLDGYRLAERIRKLPGCQETLLIAITGYGDAEYRSLAEQAGFQFYFLKPVESKRLNEILEDQQRKISNAPTFARTEGEACSS